MKNKAIRGLFYNCKNGTLKEIIFDNFNEMRDTGLKCDCASVITRYINNKPYDIWFDDEFLLKLDDKEFSEVSGDCIDANEMLFGNLFITAYSDKEYIESLTSDDIFNIMFYGLYNNNKLAMQDDKYISLYRSTIGDYPVKFSKDRKVLIYKYYGK